MHLRMCFCMSISSLRGIVITSFITVKLSNQECTEGPTKNIKLNNSGRRNTIHNILQYMHFDAENKRISLVHFLSNIRRRNATLQEPPQTGTNKASSMN